MGLARFWYTASFKGVSILRCLEYLCAPRNLARLRNTRILFWIEDRNNLYVFFCSLTISGRIGFKLCNHKCQTCHHSQVRIGAQLLALLFLRSTNCSSPPHWSFVCVWDISYNSNERSCQRRGCSRCDCFCSSVGNVKCVLRHLWFHGGSPEANKVHVNHDQVAKHQLSVKLVLL